jgi:dihydrodipicolinate synthase/N-acetylneuraminate lyase
MIRYGFLAAAKEAMRARGIDLGPVRAPNANLTPEQVMGLRRELEEIGFATMTRAG